MIHFTSDRFLYFALAWFFFLFVNELKTERHHSQPSLVEAGCGFSFVWSCHVETSESFKKSLRIALAASKMADDFIAFYWEWLLE
jgi:hypothetical protein